MLPDPYRRTIFLDSCAFDPKYAPEDQASEEIFRRYEEGNLKVLNIAHSTLKEIDHPNTPERVKREATATIFTLPVDLTGEERRQQEQILDVLAGNGGRDKMRQDATHVFEASKYGGYFITTDERILKRRDDLRGVCGAIIVRPSEFIDVLAQYDN